MHFLPYLQGTKPVGIFYRTSDLSDVESLVTRNFLAISMAASLFPVLVLFYGANQTLTVNPAVESELFTFSISAYSWHAYKSP